jgi:PAS domain S-box-containing protein
MRDAAARALRLQAELRLLRAQAPLPHGEEASPQHMRELLHDLQVHQMELEMQNDELRRTQMQLELSSARYFELYDLAPVGYCTVSEKGLILEANFTAAQYFGRSRGELVRMPLSRFIVRSDQDSYYKCRTRLFDTLQTQSCEVQLVQADASPLWVKVVVSAATGSDGLPVQRMVLGDITERRQLDLALQAQNLELAQARQAADQASQAKSDFLSNMSHELRSPLNAILGFAQLIESGKPEPTPTQLANTGQILRAGWYLLDLINEILDLAQVESGHLTLCMETFDLHELLRDCATLTGPLADKRSVQLQFPSATPAIYIQADPTRVKQVLVNLLSNAVKYNRNGGSVEVSLSLLPEQRLRIQVRDTGLGLTPEELTRLFQPFNRLGQQFGGQEGTGIGLAISRRLSQAMGGSMGAESTPGVGSMFWVELDILGATPPPAEALPSSAATPAPAADL